MFLYGSSDQYRKLPGQGRMAGHGKTSDGFLWKYRGLPPRVVFPLPVRGESESGKCIIEKNGGGIKRKPERNQAGKRVGGRCRRHFPRTLAVSTISDTTFYAHCAVDLLRKIEYSFFKGKCEENNPLSTPPRFFPAFWKRFQLEDMGTYPGILPFRSSYGKRFPVCGISQRIYNIKEEM